MSRGPARRPRHLVRERSREAPGSPDRWAPSSRMHPEHHGETAGENAELSPQQGRARVRHSRAVSTPPVRSVHPMDPIGSVGRGWLMGMAASSRTRFGGQLGRRCRAVSSERVDALGDELRVVFDPAQQRRAAGVLPEQAEEVHAGDVGDAAPMRHGSESRRRPGAARRSGRAGTRSPTPRRRRRARSRRRT